MSFYSPGKSILVDTFRLRPTETQCTYLRYFRCVRRSKNDEYAFGWVRRDPRKGCIMSTVVQVSVSRRQKCIFKRRTAARPARAVCKGQNIVKRNRRPFQRIPLVRVTSKNRVRLWNQPPPPNKRKKFGRGADGYITPERLIPILIRLNLSAIRCRVF